MEGKFCEGVKLRKERALDSMMEERSLSLQVSTSWLMKTALILNALRHTAAHGVTREPPPSFGNARHVEGTGHRLLFHATFRRVLWRLPHELPSQKDIRAGVWDARAQNCGPRKAVPHKKKRQLRHVWATHMMYSILQWFWARTLPQEQRNLGNHGSCFTLARKGADSHYQSSH